MTSMCYFREIMKSSRVRPLLFLRRTLLIVVVLGLCFCIQQIGMTVWFSSHEPRTLVGDQLKALPNKADKPDVHGGQRTKINHDADKHLEMLREPLAETQLQSLIGEVDRQEQQQQEQQQHQQQQQQQAPEGIKLSSIKSVDKKGNNSHSDNEKPKKQPNNNPDEKRPPVVLATTNSAFLDFAKNWLESIRRLKSRPSNITIVTEDDATYDSLAENPEVHRVKPNIMLPPNQTLIFDTPAYKAFVNKRPKYILDLLQKNYDVLFSDVDTVWLEDPFTYFTGDYDMFIQEDQPRPKQVLCAGFSYFRSTQNTINFITKWIKRLESNKNKRPDQIVLNIMLRERAITRTFKYKVLNSKKFVSGRYYFDEEWRKNNTDVKPVFLHNNWIVGHDIKVERFKKLGYWYVD